MKEHDENLLCLSLSCVQLQRVLNEFLPGILIFKRWMEFYSCQLEAQQDTLVNLPLEVSLGKVMSRQGHEVWGVSPAGRPRVSLIGSITGKVGPEPSCC